MLGMLRGALILAMPALLRCSSGHCGLIIECMPPLVVDAQVPIDASAVDGLTLSFCRNGACATGIVFQGTATLFGAQGAQTFHVGVATKAIASGRSDITFTPSFDGFVDSSGDVADGDTYEVEIANGSNVIVDDTRAIDFTHGPAGCRDGACYEASYTIME